MNHFIMKFSINLKFTTIKRKRIKTYIDFKSVDLLRFVSNIKTEISFLTSLCPVHLNSMLQNIINIYTYFSHELFTFKKSVRKFENKYIINPSNEIKLDLSRNN